MCAKFAVDLALGVQNIKTGHDFDNNPNTSLSPCDPLAFANMLSYFIVNVFIRFQTRLEKRFNDIYIVASEE